MNEALERYCRWLARVFFVVGMDSDDLAQEARLAAWLAPPGAERIAARRRILDLIKFSQRRPLFAPEVEIANSADVVDLVLARERIRGALASPLSDRERHALGRAIRGESVAEKSIENALARARRKLAA